MKKVFFILMTVILTVCLPPAAAYLQPDYGISGDDDVLPWPWGTECPFPWNEIEGVWGASYPESNQNNKRDVLPIGSAISYYEFKIQGVWASGTKVVEIIKYSYDGDVIGRGTGYAPSDQKIVRAVILAAEGVNMANHRVIVRAYRQRTTLSCGGELVTVLTTRSISNEKETDRHFVLKKIPIKQ